MRISKEAWVEKGYEISALEGIQHLKIEQLAKAVGISKSSFYHHFADMEGYREALFNHHFKQCALIAEKEKASETIDPQLINILLEHRIDLLFHRQLRISRNDEAIANVLEKAIELLGDYAVMLWAKEINLKLTKPQLEGLFKIATDDFYMQINAGNLTYDFLSDYFNKLSSVTKQFTK